MGDIFDNHFHQIKAAIVQMAPVYQYKQVGEQQPG